MDRNTSLMKIMALSVLPGLLLLFQNYGIYSIFPKTTPLWALPCLIAGYCLAILIVGIAFEKRIGPWLYAPLGGLLYETWLGWNWISINLGMSTFLIDYILLILTMAGLWRVFAHRTVIPRRVWVWAAVLFMGIAISRSFQIAPELGYTRSILLATLRWAIHTIPIVWLVRFFMIRGSQPSHAILLAVALTPFLIEKLLGNSIGYYAWTSSSPRMQMVRAMFVQIPVVVFLILLPLVAAFMKESRYFRWFLYSASFAAICLAVFLLIAYLHDSDQLSTLPSAIEFILILYSPILLSAMFPEEESPPPPLR